jgi:predicted AAA+ superfamily ATPase
LDNLKFWRTKDERYEVDLVIENKKLAIEIKCKTMDKIKQLDYKGLKKFNQLYPDFKTMLVNLDNFYEVLQDL